MLLNGSHRKNPSNIHIDTVYVLTQDWHVHPYPAEQTVTCTSNITNTARNMCWICYILMAWSPRRQSSHMPGPVSQPTRREKHHFSRWYLALVAPHLWVLGRNQHLPNHLVWAKLLIASLSSSQRWSVTLKRMWRSSRARGEGTHTSLQTPFSLPSLL